MADDLSTAPDSEFTAIVPADANVQFNSPTDAARMLSDIRAKRNQSTVADDAKAATEQSRESGEKPDAAPVEEPISGNDAENAEPAENQPLIEPPRSWTKEAKERWQSLPRDTQEYLAAREQERERELRRGQNEAAEKLKALTAKEQAAEQAKLKYENQYPALLQSIQDQIAGQFADIKTTSDVEKLAADDPFRYLQWNAQQQKIAAVQAQMREAEGRNAREFQSKWTDFARQQDKLILDRIPDAEKYGDAAIATLRDAGFGDEELARSWNGMDAIPLRDHRMQEILVKAAKYDEAQKALAKQKTEAKTKPVPPVQRPGIAPQRGAADSQNIENLTKKLDQSGDVNAAYELLKARRAVTTRRAS